MEHHTYLRTHTLSAEHLFLDLGEATTELRATQDEQDRHAVTLVHEDGLTVVVTDLHAGAVLQEHAAPGPATIQVLDGRVEIDIAGERVEATAGRLVAFAGSVRHSVRAVEDSTLLLTVTDRGEAHDVPHV
jgi:quercetin dioxygenase-like cupin family protein